MKLAKSLLLGSAAALVAGTAAQAADLPYKKAAPVEYVRVCDWTGAGYFYIPGTDTCLKIGGFVRAEFEYTSGQSAFIPNVTGIPAGGTTLRGRNRDQTGFFARGRIETDARTQTAYGTIRTFVRYQADRYSGAENYTATAPQGSGSSTYIDKAFVQFAGITAGRVQSFFDFGADPYGFNGVATTDASTQAFAYTANFAGGFSATIAIEDPNVRRSGVGNTTLAGVTTTSGYGGDRIPDVVGQLRVDQAWGAAQLSGAYHEVTTTSAGFAKKDTEGFAVRGGVQIKLPMLAAGDEIQIEGGYASGAYSYTNANLIQGGYGSPIEVGGYIHGTPDAIALGNAAGGYTLAKAESYSVNAGFQHFFTPTVSNIIFGSYEHLTYGGANRVAWYAGGEGPASSYRIADQINWFPVKDLQIGLEVMYIKVDQKIPGTPGTPVAGYATVALPAGVVRNPDSFSGRLRIERDF